jgi:hypothetical protein
MAITHGRIRACAIPETTVYPKKNIAGRMCRNSVHEPQTRVSQAKFLLVLLVLKLIKAVNCKDFVYTTQIREK